MLRSSIHAIRSLSWSGRSCRLLLLLVALVGLAPVALVAVVSLAASPAAAQECDPEVEDPPCDPPPPGDTQAPSVTIIPSGGTFGSASQNITIEWCDDQFLSAGSKTIRLNGVDVSANFDFMSDSRPGCGMFATSTGAVTFNIGGNTLEATIQDAHWNTGYSSGGYSVQNGYVTANADFNNLDNQRAERCEAGCFAAKHVQGTVPYFSAGAPRNVTLVYDGDRAHPMPVVYVDVTGFTQDTPTIQEYWLEAKINSAFRTFRNGEQRLKFAGHQAVRRFGGQLDVRDLPTGMYPLDLILTVNFGYATEVKTFSTKLLVVNENNSAIAKGWTVAGVQRLYKDVSDGSVLITEGEGSAVYFASCGTNCFTSPRGDFSRLTFNTSTSTYTRSYVDSTKVVFDVNGLARSVTDRLGNTVGYQYDGSNRLWKIEDPYRTYAGGTLKSAIVLTYDANGLSRIDEPGPDGSPTGGRATLVTVDGSRRLTAITDPDNVSTVFGYDANVRLSIVTDRRGSMSQFVYDPQSWKLSQVVLPQIAIDAGGGGTQWATPTVTYRPWQTVGVPTALTASAPATPLPPDSTIGRITDPESRVTSTRVDRWGQAVSVTDPIGRLTSVARNIDGLATQITYPTGVSDVMSYSGPLVTMVQPAGQSATHIRYGVAGQPDSVYGAGQRWVRSYLHAATGRVDSVKVQGIDSIAKYTYDARHRVMEYKDHRQHRWISRYDARTGNPDSTHSWPSNHFRVTRFDGYGRDSVALAEGELVQRVIYDVLNRPRQIFAGTMPTPITIGYDSLFRTSVTDPKGQQYRYEHNAIGWLTREYDPVNASMTYRHDRTGQLTSWTNRRGQRVDYAYDAVGRLLKKSGINVVTDSFTYSPDGRRVFAQGSWTQDSLFYNAYGRLDSAMTHYGVRYMRNYRWSQNGNLDSLRVATDGFIAFPQRRFFWNGGVLDSLKIGTQKVAFTYNQELQRATTTFPVGSPLTVRAEAYSSLHQRVRTSFNTSAIDGALWRNNIYDVRGRLRQEDRKDGSVTRSRVFGYDHRSQLASLELATTVGTVQCPEPQGTEIINDGQQCTPTTERTVDADFRFAYDSAGNLTQETDLVSSTVKSGVHTTGNRIQSWAGATYVHDADGNRISKTVGGVTTTYTWSADGQLLSVAQGSTTLSYRYDAFGRVVIRMRNGVVNRAFLWDEDQLLAELDNGFINRVAEYVHGPGIDNPVAILTGPSTVASTRFFQEDALGNIVGVFGSAVTQTLRYDARGNLEMATGVLADTNRLRWKGLLWEGDVTQLYYMRNRWYDPESGRFLSEDPLGVEGGLNLYVFAHNDAVNGIDPLGLCSGDADDTYQVAPGTRRTGRDGSTWICGDDGMWREVDETEGGGGDDHTIIVIGIPGVRGPSSAPHGGGDGGGGGGVSSALSTTKAFLDRNTPCIAGVGGFAFVLATDAMFFLPFAAPLAMGARHLSMAAMFSRGSIRYASHRAMASFYHTRGMVVAGSAGLNEFYNANDGVHDPIMSTPALTDFIPGFATRNAFRDMNAACGGR